MFQITKPKKKSCFFVDDSNRFPQMNPSHIVFQLSLSEARRTGSVLKESIITEKHTDDACSEAPAAPSPNVGKASG